MRHNTPFGPGIYSGSMPSTFTGMERPRYPHHPAQRRDNQQTLPHSSEKGDYTVRIYGDKTDLFINRDYEAHTIQEMARVGVASNMIKYMPELGVTIVEFIGDSIVLNNEHFLEPIAPSENRGADPQNPFERGAAETDFQPPGGGDENVGHSQRLNAEYKEFDIAGTIERLIKLSSIINIPESEYTPCHNDLLADNFILINDDARDRVRCAHVSHRLGVCRNGTQLL